MAVLDLATLQPTVISRDLKGKYVCLYGEPGVGKTSLAASFPNNLILGFEHGTNAIGGIFMVDISTWADFKAYVKQLKKAEMKAKFDTICIDTIGLAWDRCIEYICDKNDVDKISEIPYGGGYAEARKEFEKMIITITQLGYGLVIIAHADIHMEADPENENTEIKVLGPAIPKKVADIINRLVDITAYIGIDKNKERWLYLRSTPTITAKSRFRYTPDRIPMGYQNLVDAIGDAIEQESANGVKVVDAPVEVAKQAKKVDFNKLIVDIRNYALAMNAAGKMSEYSKITAEYLGKGRNVKDCNESQIDMLLLILDDLKDYCSENDITIVNYSEDMK